MTTPTSTSPSNGSGSDEAKPEIDLKRGVDLTVGNPGRDPGYVTVSVALKLIQERWSETDIGIPGHRPSDLLEYFKGTIQCAELLLKNIDPSEAKDWRAAFRTEPVTAKSLTSLIDEPIPYIIKPLVVRGSLTQIQGMAKGGKSSFSLYLALCAAKNVWPNPQYLVAEAPLNVLYIAWEDPKIMMAKRLSLYARGLGLDKYDLPDNITFLFGPDIFIENDASVAMLKAAVDELKPDFVVIDTLSHIHLMDENASSEIKVPMKNLDRFAKEQNIGIIYLHHTAKGSSEKATQDKGRGSTAIAAAWHVLVDWGNREKGSNVNQVVIQSKFESKWRDLAITYDAIEEDGDVVAIKWQIDSLEPEVAEAGSTVKKLATITTLMKKPEHKDHWWTAQEVAEGSNLGLDAKSIKRHLTTLCEGGFLDFKPGSPIKGGGMSPNFYRFKPGNLI
jgi:hypothetical protein